jgi:alpha-galactosidase
MRIGADVDPSWRHWSKIFIGKKYVMGAANAIHNTITRYFMHQKFWINDPDCVLVREDRTKLLDEEIESLITVVGLSGGMVLSSDNYTEISDERLKWLAKLIPPSGVSAVPFDLMENEMPQVLMLNDKKSGKILISFINWKDKPANFRLNLKELKIPVGDYHLFEFWGEAYLGIISSEYTLLSIPAHGCRLISLQPVEKFPQIIASNFHITCGIVEIAKSNYNPQSRELYFKIDIGRYASGKIFISLPEGFQEKKISSSAKSHKVYRSDNTILAIETTVEKEAVFKIDFDMSESCAVA